MEVYEKVNLILKQKKMTKRKFSNILRSLEPRLKSTGEAPIETTIYKYLNGTISIPIELVPYIADALDVTEQELFNIDAQTKIKLHKLTSKVLDKKQVNYLNTLESSSNIVKDNHVPYAENSKAYKTKKLISLLIYAPDIMIDNIIHKLEEIEQISSSQL